MSRHSNKLCFASVVFRTTQPRPLRSSIRRIVSGAWKRTTKSFLSFLNLHVVRNDSTQLGYIWQIKRELEISRWIWWMNPRWRNMNLCLIICYCVHLCGCCNNPKVKLLKNGNSKLHCKFAIHERTVFFWFRMLRLYICSFLFRYEV